MTFDLSAILASKRALRRSLADRDILEKLRLLDTLRERAFLLRAVRSSALSRPAGSGQQLRRSVGVK